MLYAEAKPPLKDTPYTLVNPVPVIVTVEPSLPWEGVKEVKVGGVTVNEFEEVPEPT